ncbi:MAG: biotin/lipoate--protein ligase family protein [Bosea sp. (in: a-proteobacteria)]
MATSRPLSQLDDQGRDPVLPPGFTLVTLRESGNAFAHAKTIAAEAGAATVVWVKRFDLVEFAVVLEPDAPLATARLSHYLCMNALADSLAAHCPPERPIVFRWPDALLYDLGLIGGGQCAWPEACGEQDVPEWLVFGGMVRAVSMVPFEAAPAAVSMEDEGFGQVGAVELVESFARHLMLGVSRWHEQGPKATVKRWLDRIEKVPGQRQGIEPNGDLVMTAQEGSTRHSLIEALHKADWLDVEQGGPKL